MPITNINLRYNRKHEGIEKWKCTDDFKGNYFRSSRNRFPCYLNYSKPTSPFSIIMPALHCQQNYKMKTMKKNIILTHVTHKNWYKNPIKFYQLPARPSSLWWKFACEAKTHENGRSLDWRQQKLRHLMQMPRDGDLTPATTVLKAILHQILHVSWWFCFFSDFVSSLVSFQYIPLSCLIWSGSVFSNRRKLTEVKLRFPLAGAALVKIPHAGGFTHRISFLNSSWGWEVQDRDAGNAM